MGKMELRARVTKYDETCLVELEEVFNKNKTMIKQLLEGGLDKEFLGLDQEFVRTELKSRLHTCENMKEFILGFGKYQEVKTF